ncbi:MAG: hypothetical protein ABR592_09325 [Nitriliruptorales bacterium]
MERAGWLEEGFDAPQARFLMVTAITHHRSSSLWGEDEVRKLQAELAEIDVAAEQVESEHLRALPGGRSSLAESATADQSPSEEEEPGLWGLFS